MFSAWWQGEGFGLAATARHHLRAEPDSGFWRGVLHQFEHVEWLAGLLWQALGCPLVKRIWTPAWAL